MRKISKEIENPIDNIFIELADTACPFFKSLNFTPNMLTTMSLIIHLYSLYNIMQKKYEIASLLYLLAYFFDCIDGHYARKYNMTSKFGDYYDHISDYTKTLLLFAIVIYALWDNKDIIFYYGLVIMILIYPMLKHFCYTEKENNYFKNKEKGVMSSDLICNSINIDSNTSLYKYFGIGTVSVSIAVMIYLLKYFIKN